MPENIVMPRVGGYDVQSVVLLRWLKHEGDTLQAGDAVAEVESAKATIELPAPHSGTLLRIVVEEGTEVSVGTVLAVVELDGEQIIAKSADANITATASVPEHGTRSKVSPVARKLAEEWHLDLRQIQGTGPGGRITREDVERTHNQMATESPKTVSPESIPAPSSVEWSETVPILDQPLSKMRRVIAERMTESATSVPHFVIVNEVDMEAALEIRGQLNARSGATKVSITDLVVRAVAIALQRFPILNSSYAGDHLVIHPNINIGFAVMLEGGLVTPVIHQANEKSLFEVADLSATLIERARLGRLQVDDLSDGTFTITNLGMFDVEHFIPIINPPEAAILAIGTARTLAVVMNGEILPRRRMNTSLAADHRVTDGAMAGQFLQEIKALLQAPVQLLI
jgi:pyruvate dehydrogenase E2 component (dihydrolipoyllysine-residue acetyltransferase)